VIIGRIEGRYVRDVALKGYEPDPLPNLFGLAPGLWIDPLPPFSHINHSCAPNAAVGRRRTIYAISEIPALAEITIDYSTTEADPFWRMACRCGTADCRLLLRPIQQAFDELPLGAPAMRRAWRQMRGANGGH